MNRLLPTFIVIAVFFGLQAERVLAIDPPEDEFSVGYNYFDGGGITVHGPAIIVRKALKGKAAIEAGAAYDLVSSASIDVVTQASTAEFTDKRRELSLGGSRILGNILVSSTYTASSESDYESNTLSFGLLHDLHDKNLSVDLRVSRSWDTIEKNSDPSFLSQSLDRSTYSLGVTQSLSPRWLAHFNYELTADRGFINNPYRSAWLDTESATPERYPGARTGQAVVLRSKHGFVSRGASSGALRQSLEWSYRFYRDTFGIKSHTGKLSFDQYFSAKKRAGLFYRHYVQSAATFYGDRLPLSQRYKARDKELSKFSSQWFGFYYRYAFEWARFESPYLKVELSHMIFNYDNFSDLRDASRSAYSWNANVLQFSLGFNY